MKKKYPEYSELMDGFTPYQYFNKYTEDEWNKYDSIIPGNSKEYRYRIGNGDWQTDYETENPIREMMNYDYDYEPRTYSLDTTTANQLFKAYNTELSRYFVDKYGDENIPNSWKL